MSPLPSLARKRIPSISMSSRIALPLFLAGLWSLALLAPPAGANVLPPGNILFDIMPYDDWGDCQMDATSCEDVDASVPGTGAYLIHILLQPPEAYYDTPLTGLFVDLYWPDDWYLGWYAFCSGGEGTLDEYGGNPHRLEIEFPCSPVHNELFPAITLAIYAGSYGVLYPEHNEQGAFQMGCPPNVNREWPFLSFAEAGTLCDHDVASCDWPHAYCAPYFQNQELRLTGPAGGKVRGEFNFVTGAGHNYGCQPSAWADAPWLQARVKPRQNPWDWQLELDADLTSLEPGTYTTNVHVRARYNERCLPAVLTVGTPMGVVSPDTATGEDRFPQFQLVSPNPSSGPFEMVYASNATDQVRCVVYDAGGREVATITEAQEQDGRLRTISWNGRDSDGKSVMPGVYLVRIAADGEIVSGRVVVVR